MERMTYKGENGKNYVKGNAYYNHCRYRLDDVAGRLATYEDTGLEPAEINGLKLKAESLEMSLRVACDALERFTKAEREDRLVVLPCKVGDTIYVPGGCVVSEIPVRQIFIEESECFVCAIGDFRGGNYPFSAFGKTVFLTAEEAEKYLEGEGQWID